MDAMKFSKFTSVIRKGDRDGVPIYTQGAKVRALGLPVDASGKATIQGPLTFEGSFDGTLFFTINQYGGGGLVITPRNVQQLVIPKNGLIPNPAILPIKDADLFDGIQMIRPHLTVDSADEIKIDFYLE